MRPSDYQQRPIIDEKFEAMHAEAIRGVDCPICSALRGRECTYSDYPGGPRVRTYVNRAHKTRLLLAGFRAEDL